ncbi:hypothetical protein [Rhodococcus erythropolis]|uniref:hypothetical protein n=1 Tax=Rhodococcus erythropolis TaxID=1833 RepID=UPI00035CAD5B|nr:hypothetical protein [Rhodococcus erythropolis]
MPIDIKQPLSVTDTTDFAEVVVVGDGLRARVILDPLGPQLGHRPPAEAQPR